ncbi:hypothetical protein LAG90_16470 [Marinilongibacter aquaticus]|uniref:hypothetical protein n=1 Tax=Marinilongibacter aquaticus TaxID=2975157 RepID=UPI0021BDE5FD|nr:hypothetical protein [Marinilongibacter aquaticus]UBM58400.1 hypothetical protein LAG90_16470 [Marinilongibacter aquaticus]
MAKFSLLLSCMLFAALAYGQELSVDDLLNEVETEQGSENLLPERMLFTQRIFWGEKGLYRKVGLASKTITPESRAKELRTRRTYFKLHQALGFLAAGGMLAQAIIGPKLYNGDFQIRELHESVALGTNIAYGSAALLAFTAPPAQINRKGFSNIQLHKWLSAVHLSGMVATNVLGHMASEGKVSKNVHRAAAVTTFTAYTAAIVTIKFEF